MASVSPARLTLLAATVLTGLSAGFFLSYETSVTPGLARVDDTTYVTAFQAVNVAVGNPAFAATFFGPVLLIAAALVLHWTAGTRARTTLGIALLLYLAVVTITGTGNVPLNGELAEVQLLDAATAAAARGRFEDDWNLLNLFRTGAAVASFAVLAVSAMASTGLDATDRRGSR